MVTMDRPQRAFSLIEILVSLAIIAVLVGLLMPTLIYARNAARTAVCAGNLRQIGFAWGLYLDEHEQFPKYSELPDWKYGGVHFLGPSHQPVLAADRPINRYIADEPNWENRHLALLYRCPSDRGVMERGGPAHQPGPSVLDGERTCFQFYGTSYRANPYLLDANLAGIDPRLHRPLKRHEIWVAESRMLLLADPAWYYATLPEGHPQASLHASWHDKTDGGNMLAVDGSVRFMLFERAPSDRYAIMPQPGGKPPGS